MGKIKLLVKSIRRRGLFNTLRYVFFDVGFDLKHGTDTKMEITDFSFPSGNAETYYSPCQGANPWVVGKCFEELARHGLSLEQSVFLDIGSGKGRVMLMAAMVGFRRVLGVEKDSALCAVAARNFDIKPVMSETSQCVVYNEDAASFHPPPDVNVVFIYNPFGCDVLGAVMENLLASYHETQRKIYVIYVNPVCEHVPGKYGFKPISEVVGEALIYLMDKD